MNIRGKNIDLNKVFGVGQIKESNSELKSYFFEVINKDQSNIFIHSDFIFEDSDEEEIKNTLIDDRNELLVNLQNYL